MPGPTPYTLAIDQGTQSTRAIVFDTSGAVVVQAKRKIALNRIDRLRVEQDGDEMLRACQQVIQQAVEDAGAQNIACAGLATQRSSVIAWDAYTSAPLSPVLSWQDRRAEDFVQGLAPHADEIKWRSGLKLTPHYGASKMRWLMQNDSTLGRAQREGRLRIGPLASFLLHNLLRSHPYVVDQANAARTQLCAIDHGGWDPWLCKQFELERIDLPRVCPIRDEYGVLNQTAIAMRAVNGDQNAAVYAFGPVPAETALVNLGTGAFIMTTTGDSIATHHDLLVSRCDSGNDSVEYAIEGTVNGAGAALNWAAKRLGIHDYAGDELHDWLQTDPQCVFINTVGGLGSPYWRDGGSAHWLDLAGQQLDPPAQQAMAAVAESIVFLLHINLDLLRAAGITVKQLRVSGGLAQVDVLCQRLADLCAVPVLRPGAVEATARGIAWLAADRPRGWDQPQRLDRFTARADSALHSRYARFRELMDRPAGW